MCGAIGSISASGFYFARERLREFLRGREKPRESNGETVHTEPVFVDLLRRPGIDSQPGGPVRNPICRTGPPGYIG
jgi:hypothetical protein